MNKDFLILSDLGPKKILALLARAAAFKKSRRKLRVLDGKAVGLLFEKESTRTRISFEVAVTRLGGTAIYLGQRETQISRGETYPDTARVLSRYLDGIVFRTFEHERAEELARYASIPVINGLTDLHHPCQLLADMLTMIQKRRALSKLKVAYVGDGNNMTHSWMEAATLMGFSLNVACPEGHGPSPEIKKEFGRSSAIQFFTNPAQAVTGTDFIYTDTWFSMGQEVSDEKRRKFADFQVNQKLLSQANSKAWVLHCLPAHRGEEITDEVMDGPQSAVFDQAENRLYVQMALLEMLICQGLKK